MRWSIFDVYRSIEAATAKYALAKDLCKLVLDFRGRPEADVFHLFTARAVREARAVVGDEAEGGSTCQGYASDLVTLPGCVCAAEPVRLWAGI